MAVSGLANLLVAVPSLGGGGFPGPYFSWSMWIASLFLIGTGFLWVGNAPPHTRLGLVVALSYFVQGVLLTVMILGAMPPFVHPDALTMGRLVALLLFTMTEWKSLPRATAAILATATFLQILKIVVRLQFQPRAITTPLALVETGLILLTAIAIYLLGLALLKRDGSWLVSQLPGEPVTLDDFNNPEHPWNKDSSAE